MSGRFDKYIQYIKNTGEKCMVDWFDEDWEPIGPRIRYNMKEDGLIKIIDDTEIVLIDP